MAKAGRKLPKTPEQQTARLLRQIDVPEAQRGHGFVMTEVQNHSEADQRAMVRSGEDRTVRRITRVEKLFNRGTICADMLAACTWYQNAYDAGYNTLGLAADWGRAGGGSSGSGSHAARFAEQAQGRLNYQFAREGIADWLLPLFERVVLQEEPLSANGGGKATARFQAAAWQLHGRIAHLLAVR